MQLVWRSVLRGGHEFMHELEHEGMLAVLGFELLAQSQE